MKALRKSIAPMCLALAFSAPASAYDIFTGRVAVLHYNLSVTNRGVCVKLSTSTGLSPWACMRVTGALYDEIHPLLRLAYSEGRTCTLYTDWVDYPYFYEIKVVECS